MYLQNGRMTAVWLTVLFGLLVIGVAAQNALTTLGIKETDARQQMVWALSDGHVPWYGAAKVFKAADAATRAKLVQSAMAWAKACVQSASFKADYDKQREADKPAPLQPKGSVEEEMAKQRAERRKGVEDMKKNLEQTTPEMRKSMEATFKQIEDQNSKMEADPRMTAMIRQSMEMQRVNEEKAYQERIKAHEKRFPADPKILIVQRLQQFLEVTKDVDFNAKLVPSGKKMKFQDPRCEGKSENWKLCFRAGKEAVEAARAFATSWLKEIQSK